MEVGQFGFAIRNKLTDPPLTCITNEGLIHLLIGPYQIN